MASPLRDCFPSLTMLEPPGRFHGANPVQTAGPRPPAGDSLRRLRTRMGLTTRKVAELSQTIAREHGSPEFAISHARLVQIERDGSAPSVEKLFSLSAIYGVAIGDLLGLYLNLAAHVRFHSAMQHDATHLTAMEQFHEPGLRYGLIGLSDFTMSPLIRPGATVQIDTTQRMVRRAECRNEHERPVYFLETREGFLCSWCDLVSGRLVAIPHPQSPCSTQIFAFPTEVDVVGRVVAVTSRL